MKSFRSGGSRFSGGDKGGSGRSDRSSGGSFRDRGDRDDRGSRGGFDRPQMHKAVCDECGKSCTVPFRPTGGKPIYCSDCFEKHDDRSDRGGNDSFRRPERKSFSAAPRSNNNEALEKQLKDLNAKLDKILEALVKE